jgi:hypothetical protein
MDVKHLNKSKDIRFIVWESWTRYLSNTKEVTAPTSWHCLGAMSTKNVSILKYF